MHSLAPVRARRPGPGVLAPLLLLWLAAGCSSCGAGSSAKGAVQPEEQDRAQSSAGSRSQPTRPRDSARNGPTVHAPAAASRARLARGAHAFAFDLYGAVRPRRGNLILSPASLSTGLALVYAGARGETARQMRRVLHFGEDPDVLHRWASWRVARWNAAHGPSSELRAAQRLFVDRSFEVENEWAHVLQDRYHAPLTRVDFRHSPEVQRQRINRWIEQQTAGRIRGLLGAQSIGPETRLVLADAVYFRGAWTHRFDANETADGSFHLRDGTDVRVPMMRRGGRADYAEVDGAQLLQMHYRRGETSMLVALPSTRTRLGAIETRLGPELLQQWIDALKPKRVRILLPRFEMTSDRLALERVLAEMGMARPFQEDAEFRTTAKPGDSPPSLRLGDVFHRAFIRVDEQGTEAAAATGAGAGYGRPKPPPVFRADRPFLFFIRHEPTDAILFMGRVANPRGGSPPTE